MSKELLIEEETWDKKKIIVGILTASLIVGIGLHFLQPLINNGQRSRARLYRKVDNTKEVAGASMSGSVSLPAVWDVQSNIDIIQQQITQLDVNEIASSSPQVQKIIKDIQSIQQFPRNQAKEMCQQICNRF